jgi:hypothetical protein
MITPIAVWHCCGDVYGYQIDWPKLMAVGIWPWGLDLAKIYPQQRFVVIGTRDIVDDYGWDDARIIGKHRIEDFVTDGKVDNERLAKRLCEYLTCELPA